MNRNSFILLIVCLILPLQVLACNCGCKHGSCGSSQNSCSQKTDNNTNNNCSGNSNANNVSCMAEQRISSNNLSCNGNNYTCGGNKK